MNAPAKKAASDKAKNDSVRSEKAITNMQRLIAAWVARIQVRLVEYTSTKGPQNILMTQGR